MNRTLSKVISKVVLLLLFICTSFASKATHIYGADLFYTYVSGNTYRITLNVYGDCAGAAFPALSSASAQVQVFNGSTSAGTITLALQNPTAGVEVTPVCPSVSSVCVSSTSTIPGVKKFVYSNTVTLSTTSTNWRFRFTGNMGSTTQAGRSSNLTNISSAGSVIMNLEATLNNTVGTNSSPTYTTIPTPFFCINKAATYNSGSVDANSDSLSYNLVPGLTQTGNVTYLTGYSATSPLAAAATTFNFNSNTGQLAFTPNLVQQSLVVYQVNEYRNGVLVGTSMREMTFVVLNNCNNNAPAGVITNANAGTVVNNGTQLDVCKSSGNISFNINPTDLDNDKINITSNGLPVGATYTVTNNTTLSPTGLFSWNLANVPAGTYNFFLTYLDDGCPLASRQTQAYTIKVLPDPSVAFSLIDSATCTKKAVFSMTPSVSPSPWRLQVIQGATTIHNFLGVTGSQIDSLSPGPYTIRVKNSDSCFWDTSIVIPPPPTLGIALNVTPPRCHNDTNGVVVVSGVGGKPSFTYAIGSSPFGTTDTFKNIGSGFFTFKVKDNNECEKDTLISIANPTAITADITLIKPTCNAFSNGEINIIAANGISPYTYALGAFAYDTIKNFTGLVSGNYLIKIKDDKDCVLDTLIDLPDSLVITATASLTDVLCNGDSTGIVVLTGQGGTSPYRYALGSGALTPTNTFNTLSAITHTFKVVDTNNCFLDTNITLTEPARIVPSPNITQVLCFGDTSGKIEMFASGGVSPYTYALGTGTFGVNSVFTPLAAGTYQIRIQDDNNCIRDTSVIVTQPNELKITSLTHTNPLCFGSADGTVSLTGAGGVSPYEYALGAGPFSSNSTFSSVADGTYTVTLRDNNDCTKDTSVTLNQPPRIVPSVDVDLSTCVPLNNGKMTLTATGGTPGYTYAIGSGSYSSTNVFTAIASGAYILSVKDLNDCVIDTNIIMPDSIIVTAQVTKSNITCFNQGNGTISVLPGGGVNPYTYSFNSGNFNNINNYNNLQPGVYTLSVKDDIGCKKDTTITLTQPQPLRSALTITNPICEGTKTGVVVLTPTGGTLPYQHSLDAFPFAIPNSFSSLAAGQHRFRTIDSNGCLFDTTVTLTQPPKLEYTLVINDVLCNGDSTGSVLVNGSGGTPGYTYTFDQNTFGSNPLVTGINVGSHFIRMQDSKGCIKDSMVFIKEPKILDANIQISAPTCEDFADGAIDVNGVNGTSPYLFATDGSSFSSNNIISELKAGTYSITVKDANDCIYDTVVTLTGYPVIVLDEIISDPVSCFGYEDGGIEIAASGGLQPFEYKVGNSQFISDNQFRGLLATDYIITVKDSVGCEKDTSVTVESPERIVITTKSIPNDCDGYDNTGVIEANVAGGTEPYRYLWNTTPNQIGSSLRSMPNGTYKLVVTDFNDCIEETTADITYNNCCSIFIPDAFTPNNDGLNDKIRILFKGEFKLDLFSIYNRFGERVFTTNNIDGAWDGIWKGKPQDLATYNYYVKGICGNQEVIYKGTITLIR